MHLDRHPPGRHPQADIPRQTSPGWHPQADTPTPRWPLHRMVCILPECFLVASHFRTSEPRFENLSMLPSLDNPGNSKVLWLTCYHPQHICSKVIFLPLPQADTPLARHHHPAGKIPPPPRRRSLGRYAYYWNAFLLVEVFEIYDADWLNNINYYSPVGNFFNVTLW